MNTKRKKYRNCFATGGYTNIPNTYSQSQEAKDSMKVNNQSSNRTSNVANIAPQIPASSNYGDMAPYYRPIVASNNDELMSSFGVPKVILPREDERQAGNQGALAGAGTGAALGSIAGPIGSLAGFLLGGFAGQFKQLGAKKRNKETAKKENRINIDLQNRNISDFNAMSDKLSKENYYSSLANYSAMGGGIHIKPENRGKFNATKKITGKSTEELTHSKNPITRKRAIFAQNAAKWNKKGEGGNLFSNGGEFTNGATIFANGGSHESNPNSGVQQGIGENGLPNLVEEGEVKYNDYIFSNRLTVPKKSAKEFNVPKSYEGKPFSKVAKSLQKESKERPNDPISQNGLNNGMEKLESLQEFVRAKNQMKDKSSANVFAGGGPKKLLGDLPGIGLAGITNGSDPMQLARSGGMEFAKGSPQSTPGIGMDALRYAPALGSAVGVITDLFGKTNKPDYSNAKSITDSVQKVSTSPVGNYMEYKPLDRDYYTNKLAAQSGATRRALQDASGGNRANYASNILAADYAAQSKLGDLSRQAEESNLAQRQQVENFNRGTNMFNTQTTLSANSTNANMGLQAAMAAANIRNNQDMASSAGRSANLTNLFDNIGEIGREEMSRKMVVDNPSLYYTIGRDGSIKYKDEYYDLPDTKKKQIASDAKKRNK